MYAALVANRAIHHAAAHEMRSKVPTETFYCGPCDYEWEESFGILTSLWSGDDFAECPSCGKRRPRLNIQATSFLYVDDDHLPLCTDTRDPEDLDRDLDDNAGFETVAEIAEADIDSDTDEADIGGVDSGESDGGDSDGGEK